MKTEQIMKIEYAEPLMKVKEIRRRRCVVANSDTNEMFGNQKAETEEEDIYASNN